MYERPFNANPGVADFKKGVVWVFVVDKLVALIKENKAKIGVGILNGTVRVFGPSKVCYPPVVGK